MRPIVLWLLLMVTLSSQASFFDLVKKEVTSLSKVNVADSLYQELFKNNDSTTTLKALNELQVIANEADDVPLKCYVLSTFGDYYARIRDFGELSTNYHLQAIELSKSEGSKIAEAISNFKLGRYYYNFRRYPKAFEYLLRANYLEKDIGYSSSLQSGWLFYYLAKAYHEIGDFANAEFYYRTCMSFNTDNDWFKKIQSLNSLAIIASNRKDYTTALVYLRQILAVSQKSGVAVWTGLSNGLIGDILYKQGKYDSAKNYLQAGYTSNISFKEWGNANNCVLNLGAIALQEKNTALAKSYIDSARFCLQKSNSLLNQKRYFQVLVNYYQAQGNTIAALDASQKLSAITDSLQQQINQQEYKGIEIRIEAEKHLSQIANLELQAKNAAIKTNAVIAILLLLAVLLLFFYRNQKHQRKVDKLLHARQEALLQSEKQLAEETLNHAQLLLKDYTENIRKKNELVQQVSSELKILKSSLPIEQTNPEKLAYFDKLVKSTILTAEDWDNFRALFNKVHPSFFYQLKDQYPNLSESDRRLLSLIKLQLSNREMANMQGVTIDAVKKAKQRLRKKMAPADETFDLEKIVINI